MAADEILVRVDAERLPLRARALLDSGIPRPAHSRFLVRRTYISWAPAAWLVFLLVIGISSLWATIAAGLNPSAGDERVIYGVMTAICLFFAVFAAGKLIVGLTERRDVKRGDYRLGLHLLGLDGLLIAGRDVHTWVPRGMLPEPVKITSGSGESVFVTYVYTLVDAEGRAERLDCSTFENKALWMWQEHGHMPEGSEWK
ncbi:MAG: hypothetical protein B7C55_11375 [Actinomycetales bacterium mxb001]|nr:MAG: hypothetical protein B7C55_11375 [Actinomycetales bacterium mxb001]